MNTFMTFLANHYIWFLLITIVLLFALIGYFLDSKNEPVKKKEELTEKMITDKIETLENKPLNEMVQPTPKEEASVPPSVVEDIPILMPEEKPVEVFEMKND